MNLDLAKKILKKHGKVDLIFSANTISHIPNLDEVFKSINLVLAKNGVFVFEDPYILSVIKNQSYDQFYDEHAHVFSLLSISTIINQYNLKVFNIEKLDTHGGSIRYYISYKDSDFKANSSVTNLNKIELNNKLNKYSTYKNFGKKYKNLNII